MLTVKAKLDNIRTKVYTVKCFCYNNNNNKPDTRLICAPHKTTLKDMLI